MEPHEQDFKAKIITFREVFDLSHKISRQISEIPLSFDVIVGIARGGLPPARLLCDFLNIDNLTSLQIRHYSSGAQQMENPEMIDPVDVDIKEKNVLLVDDVNDSGKTFEAALEHVQSFDPTVVKTAVIHEKDTSVFEADFVGKYQEKWKWLVYEWAITEDILEFLNRDDMLGKSKEKALNHLKEKYDLQLDTERFQKIMEMRGNYI